MGTKERNIMSDKPNCYECKHRREVPGSAHSKCAHPAFDKVASNPLLGLAAMLGGAKIPHVRGDDSCVVVGHPHGIARGWFGHPFNFDPRWLQSCTGFSAKDQS